MRLILLAPLMLIAAPAHAAEPILGQWVTQNGGAVVTIARCGSAVCGRISRILKPNPANPDAVDRNNKKTELRGRKLIGLAIIPSFSDSGSDWRGRIYSPETGGEYDGYLRRNDDGTLAVKGCVAALLCQTQTWKPYR